MKVIMTRTTDVFVGLNRRTEIARNANADVFVSVHLNAHTGTANGVETFTHNNSTASNPLARNVNNQMRSQLSSLAGRTITNRGVKKANFAVLRGTYQSMLSILTESLFMDNKADSEVIKHKDFANTVAKAIADGIRGTVDNDSTVVIDAGHGGHDPGASGYGLLEKNVALKIALALRGNLQGTSSSSTSTSSSSTSTSGVQWVGTNDKGKRVESIYRGSERLNFYDSPRWTNPSGQFKYGEGWIVDNKYLVNGSPQYRVQNSKGDLYFITASDKYVRVVGASSNKNVTTYKGDSIVDYLNLKGNKHLGGSSFNNRKRLAEQHGINNYRGTSSQNTRLLNALRR